MDPCATSAIGLSNPGDNAPVLVPTPGNWVAIEETGGVAAAAETGAEAIAGIALGSSRPSRRSRPGDSNGLGRLGRRGFLGIPLAFRLIAAKPCSRRRSVSGFMASTWDARNPAARLFPRSSQRAASPGKGERPTYAIAPFRRNPEVDHAVRMSRGHPRDFVLSRNTHTRPREAHEPSRRVPKRSPTSAS
jgi:hypothetical protein